MQDKYKDLFKKLNKNPKTLLIIGITGILLIGLSSVFSKKDEPDINSEISSFDTDKYVSSIEQDIKEAISFMLGSDKVSVLVTLDSSVEYVYADENKRDTENEVEKEKTQQKDSNENNYVLYKDNDGKEIPLTITEIMPSIKGVLVVCQGGNNETVQNMVKRAVITVLDVAQTRVCVTGFSE